MNWAHTIFWASLFLIFYTYLGYALFLRFLIIIRKKPVVKKSIYPFITILIPVHNGEKHIKSKLENTLHIEYPKEKMEIIVISDDSKDKTNEIVEEYKEFGVKLITLNERGGKEIAQKVGIEQSRGEIIIFTDVSTVLRKDAIANLLSNFYDETIGCVSGEDVIKSSEEAFSSTGEKMYGGYELSIRRLESLSGTMIGVSGCFFGLRKKLIDSWPVDVPSDLMVPLLIIRKGKRVVSESKAICYVGAVKTLSEEFERKIRTLIRGMTTLFRRKEMLNPFSWGLVAVQLLSHKILRWLIPILLISLLIGNAGLIYNHWVYHLLFILQITFYISALLAILMVRIGIRNKIARFLAYYLMSNISIVIAWLRYLSGDGKIMWEPSMR